MCRIFYSLNQPNTESKIYRFLKQSDHLEKNTPGIDSASDHHTQSDGFGLAGLASDKWSVYKTPRLYKEVANLDDIVKKMAAHSLVIGHIRRCDTTYSTVRWENTHPFYYRNHVFLHNGYLRHYSDHRSKVEKLVDPDLRVHIKGNTDSETMFYLILSILRKQEGKMGVERLHLAFQELFRQVSSIVPKYNANIIYGNKEYSVVIRYAHGRQDPPSLYINGSSRNGMLITSEPISRSYSIIPRNCMMVMDNASGNYSWRKV
jgi:glutamine amidotransferase